MHQPQPENILQEPVLQGANQLLLLRFKPWVHLCCQTLFAGACTHTTPHLHGQACPNKCKVDSFNLAFANTGLYKSKHFSCGWNNEKGPRQYESP